MADRTPLPWEAVAAKYADDPAKLEDARNRYFQSVIAPKYGTDPDAILAARAEWDANTTPKGPIGKAADAAKRGLSSFADDAIGVGKDLGVSVAKGGVMLAGGAAQVLAAVPRMAANTAFAPVTAAGRFFNQVQGDVTTQPVRGADLLPLTQFGRTSGDLSAIANRETGSLTRDLSKLQTPEQQGLDKELGLILDDKSLGEVERAKIVAGHLLANPRALVAQGAQAAPMMLGAIGFGRAAARGVAEVEGTRAAQIVLERGGTLEQAQLAGKAIGESAAQRAALHGAMAGNTVMEGGAAWGQAYNEAVKVYSAQNADAEEKGMRPIYSEDDIDRKARNDADAQMSMAGIFATVGERLLGGFKLETAAATGKRLPAARALGSEMSGEFGSGFSSSTGQNAAARSTYEPDRPVFQQSLAQGVLEAGAAAGTTAAVTAGQAAKDVVSRPRGGQPPRATAPGSAPADQTPPAAPGTPPAAGGTPPIGDLKAERPATVKPAAKPRKGEDGPTVYGDDLPDLSMQERDRSKAAPVAQMTAIAQAPYFDRIGPSNSSEIGAPMVSVKGGGEVPGAGRAETVLFPDGSKVPARYAVVEADTVLASHSADGKKNDAYYAPQPGAVVALNNARTAGMQEAYRRGTADEYRTKLAEQAQSLGIDPKSIEGMKAPLLVRVYDDAVNAQKDLGRLSNTSHALSKSAAEVAFNDARLLDPANIDRAGGDPLANDNLVRQFLNTVPETERAGLIGADGSPTKQLRQRIDDAIFARAYRSPEMSNMAIEDSDPDVKGVLDAMRQAAGAWARVEKAGKLDLRPQVVRGAWALIDAKARGLKPAEALAQGDMLGRDPVQDAVTRMLADNIRSPKKMAAALRELAQVIDQASNERESMFGGDPPTIGAILEKTNRRLAKGGEGAPQFAARETQPRAGDRGSDGARGPGGDRGDPLDSATPVAARKTVDDRSGSLFGAPPAKPAATSGPKVGDVVGWKVRGGEARGVVLGVGSADGKLRVRVTIPAKGGNVGDTAQVDPASASIVSRAKAAAPASSRQQAEDLFSAPAKPERRQPKSENLLKAMRTPAEEKMALPAEEKFAEAQAEFPLPAEWVAELRLMYQEAHDAFLDYAAKAQRAQDVLGGQAIVAPLKSPVRAQEKLLEAIKEGAPIREGLKDLLRSTVVVNSQFEVQTAIDAILAQFPGAIIKRNLLMPDSKGLRNTGYHDVLINVPVGNLMSEVQVNFPEMLDIKEGDGHKFYEEQRKVTDKIAREGRKGKETPEEREAIDHWDREQFAVYDPPWRIFNARSGSSKMSPSPNDGQVDAMGSIPGRSTKPSPRNPDTGKNVPRGSASTQGRLTPLTSENSQAPVGDGGNPSGSFIFDSPSGYNSNTVDTAKQGAKDDPRNGSSGSQGPGSERVPAASSGRNAAVVGEGSREGNESGKRGPDAQSSDGVGLGEDGVSRPSAALQQPDADVRRAGDGGNAPRVRKLRAKSGLNYRFGPGDLNYEGGAITKTRQNIAAIKLLKQLEAEGRQATRAEQSVLAKYIGWGDSSIANPIFNTTTSEATWRALRDELRDLLTKEEWDGAASSTRFAHYTSGAIVRSMWDTVRRMGFVGGSVLEPGAGIGVFNGLMPADMADNSAYTGIELEPIAGGILKQLNPDENIKIESFFNSILPHAFYDMAIGNPPFSSQAVIADPEYRRLALSLHDYFFAKTIDRVKPGGLMVFVTSRFTMDKKSDKGRKYLSDRADLIGAIRLPQTAFKKNAGTEVVTDVLFLRKKVPGETFGHAQEWDGTTDIKINGKTAAVNEYFAKHPEMILGTQAFTGSMRSAEEYTVEPFEGDIEEQFRAAAASLPSDVYRKEISDTAKQEQAKTLDLDPKVKKPGSHYVTDAGALMRVREDGLGERVADQVSAVLRAYIPLRDALKQAMSDQLSGGAWEASLAALRKAYDGFVAQHGRLKENKPYFRSYPEVDPVTGDEVSVERKYRRFKHVEALKLDPENSLVMALEVLDEETDVITKARSLSERVLNLPKNREINSVEDALLVVLNDAGGVDIDRIADLSGSTREQAIEALGALIYETPNGKWAMADEYLSGNVVKKLDEAMTAAKTDARFERNVEALKNVQPAPLAPANIDVRIGMSWFPASVYEQFAKEVAEIPQWAGLKVAFSDTAKVWTVEADSPWGLRHSPYATDGADFGEILNAALTGAPIVVTERVPDGHGGSKTVINKDASLLAEQKRAELQQAFAPWFWKDEARREKYVAVYNRQFNNIVPRKFDGKHLTLPGTSAFMSIFDHVKRGVWRIIQTGNTYLAHAVGSGKTFQMVASAMEQKRLGLISKPMMVVPNHMLQQFTSEWMQLYPAARLMVADEKNFTGDKRRQWVSQVALSDLDGVIITHSAFGLLDLDPEFKASLIQEEIDIHRATLMEVAGRDEVAINKKTGKPAYSRDPKVKAIEHALEKLRQKLAAAMSPKGKDQNVRFDQLGVDMLYIDEAHVFRRLPFVTRRQVKGIDPSGSNRSFDLWLKARWLERQRPGRSLVMASGTPITNTIAEMYTVQRFMDPDEMAATGVDTFDAWASMYGREKTTLEPRVDGSYESVTRFQEFANLTSLIKSFRNFADVLTSTDLAMLLGDKRPRVDKGREIVVTPQSEEYTTYQQVELAGRVQRSKDWKPSFEEKNNPDPIINIITDGRFSALDMRFVDPSLPPDPNSKLNTMLRNVVQTWRETSDYVYNGKDGKPETTKGASQLVFSDIGFGEGAAANRGFDAKAWAIKTFREAGIPPGQIAFMSDFKNSQDKLKLFRRVNEGKVRILIGSSKNMGTGVNAQQRLIELHHLDTPWFPADLEQREGRIVRTGNKNPKVRLKGYALKGSYDETMWGMLSRKQRFIEQALSGDESIDRIEDVGEASQFEIAAAMVAKDPRVLVLAGLRAEANRLFSMYQAHKAEGEKAERDLKMNRMLAEAIRERWMPRAKERAAKAQDIAGDSFRASLNGVEYTKRAEWGAAAQQAYLDLNGGEKIAKQQIGDVGGIPVFATVTATGAAIYMEGHDSETKGVEIVAEQSSKFEPASVAMRAQREVAATRAYPDELRAKLADYDAQATFLESKAGQQFSYLEELKDKQAKVDELEAEIESAPVADDKPKDDAPPVAKRNAGERLTAADPAALHAALVKAASDEILKRWTNKPPVEILKTLDDAPQEVRDYFESEQAEGQGAVAGVLWRGKVYLIANAITTPIDVLRVMAHEVLGHYGLRALYGKDLYRILSDLLASRPADVRKVANEYGLDWSKPENREIAAEEMLVALAESRPQLGFVRRAVAAVRTWLRGLGVKVAMSDDELIRNFIIPARQFVQGGPRAPGGRAGSSPAANRAAFLPNQAQADGFRASLRMALSDMATALRNNIPLVIGNVSPVLRTIGVPEGKVRIAPGIINKVMAEKRSQDGAHGVTVQQLGNLPEWLADPVAVFKSKNNYDAWAVLSSAKDDDGWPIMVAIQMRGTERHGGGAMVQSVYGRKEQQYANWVADGLALYVDDTKEDAPSGDLRGFFGQFRLAGRRSGGKDNVLRKSALVKPHAARFPLPPTLRRVAEQVEAFPELVGAEATPVEGVLDRFERQRNEWVAAVMTALGDDESAAVKNPKTGGYHLMSRNAHFPEASDAEWRVTNFTKDWTPTNHEEYYSREDATADMIQRYGNDEIPVAARRRIAAGLRSGKGALDAALRIPMQAIRLDAATARLWDGLKDLAGKAIPEKIKAGVVDRYGVPESVIDARRDLETGKRVMLRKAENLLAKMATLTREESRALYQAANEQAPHVVARMLADLPAESRDVLYEIKALVQDLTDQQVALGLLDPETAKRNEWGYLHRTYLEHEAAMTPGEQKARQRVRGLLGDSYRGRGLFDSLTGEEAARWAPDWWGRKFPGGKLTPAAIGETFVRYEKRDTPLPGFTRGRLRDVVYLPATVRTTGAYASYDAEGTWTISDVKGGDAVIRRDFTPDERRAMGEIDEIRYALTKTLHLAMHNVEMARYLKHIADTQSKPLPPPGAVVVDGSSSLAAAYVKGVWVKVPDTKLPGTDVPKYGALAGRHLPGPVWNDVRMTRDWNSKPFGETYAKVLRMWKVSKTALSPAVHMNNVMANFVLADWQDVGASHVARAALTALKARRGDPDAKAALAEFEDHGGNGGTWAIEELQAKQLEPLLEDLLRDPTAGANVVGIFAAVQAARAGEWGQAWIAAKGGKAGKAATAIPQAMMRLYQNEDTLFRLAAYLKARDDGLSRREAGKFARDAFLDYEISAPWVQAARQTALPFVSFIYRALPKMLGTAANKPWKLAKLLLVVGGLNALGYLLSGGDEDRERKLLPEEKAGRLFFGVPKLIRMPWNDEHGNPVFLDIRRWIPIGDVFDTGQNHAAVPLLPMALPAGPVAVLAELIANRSQFTGRDITQGTDSGWEKILKVADHLFKAFSPNLMLPGPGYAVPGTDRGQLQTYAWQGAQDAATGRTDAFGRELSLPQALGNAVGIKLGSYSEEAARQRLKIEFDRQQAEIRGEIGKSAREFARRGISAEEFAGKVERQRGKLRDLAEDTIKRAP